MNNMMAPVDIDQLVKAMVQVESAGDPDAVSSKGAAGLMQLMPATARELGVNNRFDPEQNVRGGKKYITDLLDKYGGDPEKALIAYNWGRGNVAKRGFENAPPESRDYVRKVLSQLGPHSSDPAPGLTIKNLMMKLEGSNADASQQDDLGPSETPMAKMFQAADSVKRRVKGFLTHPIDTMEQDAAAVRDTWNEPGDPLDSHRVAKTRTDAKGQEEIGRFPEKAASLADDPALNFMNPSGAMAGVIKEKGGQWLSGGVERMLNSLKRAAPAVLDQAGNVRTDIVGPDQALNKWIDGPLRKYIMRDMATPGDPIRKLADQGILHVGPGELRAGAMQHNIPAKRKKMGGSVMATTDNGEFWEDTADSIIYSMKAGDHAKLSIPKVEHEALSKAPPDANIYAIPNQYNYGRSLGFDHLVDVIRGDLASGRLRPEQLTSGNFSVEAAVRRAHEYNLEQAAKMGKENEELANKAAVIREYPEGKNPGKLQGMRWVEIKDDGQLPEGASIEEVAGGYRVKLADGSGPTRINKTKQGALSDWEGYPLRKQLTYEGDTMGHCVGGYCDDVASGRTRIFSLRDAKGQPHVTVEVEPPNQPSVDSDDPRMIKWVNDRAIGYEKDYGKDGAFDAALDDYFKEEPFKNFPPRIIQIKGKQNKAPKADYLPYVQDFVRNSPHGGEWSEVGDLQNTGLYDVAHGKGLSDLMMESYPDAKKNDRILAIGRARAAGHLPDKGLMTRQEWEDAIAPHLPQNESKGGAMGAGVIGLGAAGQKKEGDKMDEEQAITPKMKAGGPVTIESLLQQLDEESEHPVEEYAAKKPLDPTRGERPVSLRMSDAEQDVERKELQRQERIGLKQGVTDPVYGLGQKAAHVGESVGLAPKGYGKNFDDIVANREKEYQKATPDATGLGRVVGNLIPVLGSGGESLVTNAATGVAVAESSPITDTSEKSVGQQSVEQGVGGLVLGTVPRMAGAVVRRTLAGDAPARAAMADNLSTFKRAGVQPSLGQVSEGGVTKGSGAFSGTTDKQSTELAAQAEKVADRLSTVRTPEQAGKVIIDGLRGTRGEQGFEGGWMGRYSDAKKALYDKADKLINPKAPVYMPATFSKLRSLTTPSKTAPATTSMFVDSKLAELRARLQADTGRSKSLPYEDVKAIRSEIGELIDPTKLDPKIDVKKAKEVYAALSNDLDAATKRMGPKAYQAMKRANDFTRAGHELIDVHIQPILNGKIPEKVFSAATDGTQEGASRVRETLKALEPAQADAVRGVVFRELGREGDGFSAQRFFSNWVKLHPDARTELFGKEGANLRTTIDRMAEVAGRLNQSGNTITEIRRYATEHAGEGGLAAIAYVTHQYGISNVLFGGAGLGFLTGRLVQNPKFMKWLSRASQATPDRLGAALVQLNNAKKSMSPEDEQEVDQYIENVGSLGGGS